MIVVIGALEAIWLARDSSLWAAIANGVEGVGASSPAHAANTSSELNARRAALRVHEKITDEIEAGSSGRAYKAAAGHLRAVEAGQVNPGDGQQILANLLDDVILPRGPNS